jgi:hypothetical protein
MRTSPDRPRVRWHLVGDEESSAEARRVPLDVNLEVLDGQLAAAGARARLAARGSTQPTRFFAQQLRGRVLQALAKGGNG